MEASESSGASGMAAAMPRSTGGEERCARWWKSRGSVKVSHGMEVSRWCPGGEAKKARSVRTALARPAQAGSFSAASGKKTDQPSGELHVVPVGGALGAGDAGGGEGGRTCAPAGPSSKTSSSESDGVRGGVIEEVQGGTAWRAWLRRVA